jgi:putative DNA primase/helicase
MAYEVLQDETLENVRARITALTPNIEWEAPILFDEVDTPHIPARLLPGIYGEFANALAVATETAPALSVMTILAVLSASAAKYFRVAPKPGWLEPLNIYTMVALPPANNKSQILKACTKPLVEWEQAQAEILLPTIKQQQSERKTQEKIIESLRLKAARLNDNSLINEVACKEAELIEPETLPRLFVNDVTSESLTSAIYEQGGHLAIFSDEGGILETLTGLYTGGVANVDILLKGIDGGYTRVKRKDKSIDLQPYLTVALVVQPGIVQKMASKKAFDGNGILERFLYVLPKSKLGYRTHDTPSVPEHIVAAYHQKINSLLNYSATLKIGAESQALILSAEALQKWQAFQLRIETQLRPGAKFSFCQGWGGKICGFALRIAGLMHIAKHGFGDSLIDKETMANALALAELLADHALAAYALMGADQTLEDAKEIFNYLVGKGAASFSRSEITTALRHRGCGNSRRLSEALPILIDRNILHAERDLSTGKPTTRYYLNPALQKESKKYGTV